MKTPEHNKKKLKPFRKKLRNHCTAAEAVLWTYLKGKQLDGRKFRRQHSVDNYILDFYCPSEKLAIELDGAEHFLPEGLEKDAARDKDLLENDNIKTLRFENKLVFDKIYSVLEEVKSVFGRV